MHQEALKPLVSQLGTHTLCPWGQDTHLSSALVLSPHQLLWGCCSLALHPGWTLGVCSRQLFSSPGSFCSSLDPWKGPAPLHPPQPSPPACQWGLFHAAGWGLEKGSALPAGLAADDCLLLHPPAARAASQHTRSGSFPATSQVRKRAASALLPSLLD